MRKFLSITLIIASWLGPAAFWSAPLNAQSPAVAQPSGRFSIGFLPEGSDFDRAPVLLEALREYLWEQQPVRDALRRAGFGQIILSPCDGPRDMIQRMDFGDGEFDLVFTSAVIYALHKGNYNTPILQTRRSGDYQQASGHDAGWLRRGALILGPGSPLFDAPGDLSDAQLSDLLLNTPLAVPSEFSAAGYLYPCIIALDVTGVSRPGQVWFCGSDSEVVKHVVSGLAQWGACSEGALLNLLPNAGGPPYYRKIRETKPFPTDPILLRNRFDPRQSPLGMELKPAIRLFFNKDQKIAPDLNVDNTNPRDYDLLIEDLAKYRRLAELSALPDNPDSRSLPSSSNAADLENLIPDVTPAPAPSPSLPPAESPDAATSKPLESLKTADTLTTSASPAPEKSADPPTTSPSTVPSQSLKTAEPAPVLPPDLFDPDSFPRGQQP